jgi:hypothetical protein
MLDRLLRAILRERYSSKEELNATHEEVDGGLFIRVEH